MSAIDSILEKIVEVATMVKNGDCPDQLIYYDLKISWKRKFYSMKASADEGQHIREAATMPVIYRGQGKVDTTNYDGIHVFIEELAPELRKTCLKLKNIAIGVEDSDRSKGVFSFKCQGSLIDKNVKRINRFIATVTATCLNISLDQAKANLAEFMKKKALEEINQMKKLYES